MRRKFGSQVTEERAKQIRDETTKVTRTELRTLASQFINGLALIRKLDAQVERLYGGEPTEKILNRYTLPDEYELWITRYTDLNGHILASPYGPIDQIEQLLKKACRVTTQRRMEGSYEFYGMENDIDTYLRLQRLIQQLGQMSYDDGVKDGSSLLKGLASGRLSPEEFNTKGGR